MLPATLLSSRDRRWLGFFLLILLAWLGLMASTVDSVGNGWALTADWRALGEQLLAVCRISPVSSGYWAILPMWLLMSVAMMAPTLLPTLVVYDDLIVAKAGSPAGFYALIGGYLAVWLGFSLLAAGVQMGLASGLTRLDSPAAGLWLNAGLFGLAGSYQFSRQKAACLRQCQQPLLFFMQHWRDGIVGSTVMGWRLGVVCLGCCWALMSLALVSGAMSLLWMGLATVFMLAEKLPQLGQRLSLPMGALLLVAAAVFAGRAAALSF